MCFVIEIVWAYRSVSLCIFIIGATVILKMTGLNKTSFRKQSSALIMATIISNIFIMTRKSSQIFYLIPPIESEQLENQRIRLVNKGLVLDGKINEIEVRPEYVDELIDEAEKEQNDEEKKNILQAAGFEVIDRIDYEYI